MVCGEQVFGSLFRYNCFAKLLVYDSLAQIQPISASDQVKYRLVVNYLLSMPLKLQILRKLGYFGSPTSATDSELSTNIRCSASFETALSTASWMAKVQMIG